MTAFISEANKSIKIIRMLIYESVKMIMHLSSEIFVRIQRIGSIINPFMHRLSEISAEMKISEVLNSLILYIVL